jgi:hypothetical protein
MTVSAESAGIPENLATVLRDLASPNHPREDILSFQPAFDAFAGAIANVRDSDACLLTVMDRFGLNAGLEREVWLRTVAWMWRRVPNSRGVLTGPYYAVGRAVAGRKLIGKGFGRTDDELVRDACAQASTRLVGTLETGRSPLFMDTCRVAVLPATIPAAVEKSMELMDVDPTNPGKESAQTVTVPLSSLQRQMDVLFQPETGPVATLAAMPLHMSAIGLDADGARDIWRAGETNNQDTLRTVAGRLAVDYIFASRVRDIEISDRPEVASDAGLLRPAVRRQVDVEVEGLLYGVRERKVLWRDTVTGGTIAITEYVRHQPRIRTDEQCLADAARTAYAHLRSSFEEYRRKFDKETLAAMRAQ